MKKTIDLALGSYEAAAVMGVHYTRPRIMLATGKVIGRHLEGEIEDPAALFCIYSSRDCERDWREYGDRVEAGGGKHYRRSRAWIHMREPALKRLAKLKHPIEYADACSVWEAMLMLNLTSPAQIGLLLRQGKLVGRSPWSQRNEGARQKGLWIVSRRSVEERKKRIIADEVAGKKPGLRKWVEK